jgi:hypothetical protein
MLLGAVEAIAPWGQVGSRMQPRRNKPSRFKARCGESVKYTTDNAHSELGTSKLKNKHKRNIQVEESH